MNRCLQADRNIIGTVHQNLLLVRARSRMTALIHAGALFEKSELVHKPIGCHYLLSKQIINVCVLHEYPPGKLQRHPAAALSLAFH